MTTADVVVAGAGHNSLICAAYLARAGREVVVLDARPVPGGGAVTEELLGPGYAIDSCSTGHTLIQANPLLARDELGLLGEQGVEYLAPDPVAHVAFPDGEQLTMWLDVERTVEELARFSRRDAAGYRRLLADYDAVKDAFNAARFTPVGMGPSLEQRLREHPVWLRRNALSAYDVVRHEFESRHVRAFLLWQAFQTLVSVDLPGSGALVYSIVYGRQKRSWTLPRGGSGRLTDALVRVIEAHGGTVMCGRTVTRLVVEHGRCTGVETDDGERWSAREAVVSTIHVKHLIDMAPPDCWDEAFRYGVETFDAGIPAFVVFLGTSAPPVFSGGHTAVSAGLAGWAEELVAGCRAVRDGRYVRDAPWLLVGTPTLADPSRAPAGHHTVKLISPQAYLPELDKEEHARHQLTTLRRFCPGFTDEVVLASLVRGPADIEAANPHMIRGTFHGGDRGLPFSGALRPAPGWAQHRMPIRGLYQTGGTTHPGGSITGGPGRNAAAVVLQDLGTSIEEVVDGGRARALGR
ncbi:MAG TPA: NAD(P)/FAD-dependent oxidoreductase [Solirubrobacteraceae bacterium]